MERVVFGEFWKDKLNIFLLLTFILGIILRLMYFNINSAVWWDEADYITYGKVLGKNIDIDYQWSPRRPFFLPMLWGFFYNLGLGEFTAKLSLLIFSIFGLVFTYLLAKEMFDKKIALFSTFILSISWLHLFFTARLLTDVPAATTIIATYYLFWKGYVKKQGNYYLYLAGLFYGISIFIRASSLIMIAPIFLYILLSEKLHFLKNKSLYISLIISLLALSPFIIWLISNYQNPVETFVGERHLFHEGIPFYGNIFKFLSSFPDYLSWPFFIFFLIGLSIFANLFIAPDHLLKDEELRKNLFLLIWIILPVIFFGLVTAPSYKEDRYLMSILPAIFYISSIGIFKTVAFIEKYNKTIIPFLLTIILLAGSYYQLSSANNRINASKDSFIQVKQAAEWIKQNSNEKDIVFSASVPQNMYYSERTTYPYSWMTEEEYNKKVKEIKPKFMIVSAFEPGLQPEWVYDYAKKYNSSVQPVQAYMVNQNQALLIIYQFLNYSF